MYHSRTDEHNKEVIMQSMGKADGTVRVVFATMALGMGVNFIGLFTTIHYGALHSLDDYFQEWPGRKTWRGFYFYRVLDAKRCST